MWPAGPSLLLSLRRPTKASAHHQQTPLRQPHHLDRFLKRTSDHRLTRKKKRGTANIRVLTAPLATSKLSHHRTDTRHTRKHPRSLASLPCLSSTPTTAAQTLPNGAHILKRQASSLEERRGGSCNNGEPTVVRLEPRSAHTHAHTHTRRVQPSSAPNSGANQHLDNTWHAVTN